MQGDSADGPTLAPDVDEAADSAFEAIGALAWRALKQANTQRKAGRAGAPEADNGH